MAPSEAPRLIVAPLREELAPFLDRLRREGRSRRSADGTRTFESPAGPCVVAVVGEGALRSRAGLVRLLDAFTPRTLFVAGAAGALSVDLAVEDVVAASVVVGPDRRTHRPDASLVERAADLPGVVPGAAVTAGALVVGRERSSLARAAPQGLPATVDLESAFLAETAEDRGIPYLVLRSVSDTADREMPGFLLRCRRRDGATNRFRVAMLAATSPRRLAEVVALARRVRRCARRLDGVLWGLIGGSS